ncbi:MAG: metallophosphoesterase family protein [Candidatus Aminicenantes bacterium]|nr:metallophosphoesterase family protein [Candidatus Aminicenantes bacterium]
MKIAALSDIHSNVFALEAVINDAEKSGVELMLNLGDILYGPIAPKATYDMLKGLNFIAIRGNEDRRIYEATQEEIETNPTMQFIRDDLGDVPLIWLKSLPFDKQINDDIYICHGTPADDSEYLLEDVGTGIPRLRSDRDIVSLLKGQSSPLVICGHTHLPRTVMLESGQLIINPGSVGLPAYTDDKPVFHVMENFSPHASYAVIEENGKSWTIQQLKVPYDYKKAAEEARKHQREDWAHFLTTGRGYKVRG